MYGDQIEPDFQIVVLENKHLLRQRANAQSIAQTFENAPVSKAGRFAAVTERVAGGRPGGRASAFGPAKGEAHMRHRLLALVVALGFFAIAAGPVRAIGDPEDRPLPFTPDQCRGLILRGAPFQIGDPNVNECFIVINWAGGPRER
jgi:hypothetical protein